MSMLPGAADENRPGVAPNLPILTRSESFKNEDVENQYELLEELGIGQFATVFKAKHRETGKVVAVKMIDRKETGADVTSVTDKEIAVMLKIDHPNCVALHEIFQTDEQLQLVMELIDGGDAFEAIKERKFNEEEVKHMMRQVCEGLLYLHQQRIIHRDIKPENILLVNETTPTVCGSETAASVKLADFGLSKVFPEDAPQASVQTRCGTPGYVAPEVLNRQPYGVKIDSWSCGIVTYIMLCGYPPFPMDMRSESIKKVNSADFKFPFLQWDRISDPAKDLIRKMIVVDPNARLSIDAALKHPWLSTEVPTSPFNTGVPVLIKIKKSPVSSSPVNATAGAAKAALVNKTRKDTDREDTSESFCGCFARKKSELPE